MRLPRNNIFELRDTKREMAVEYWELRVERQLLEKRWSFLFAIDNATKSALNKTP